VAGVDAGTNVLNCGDGYWLTVGATAIGDGAVASADYATALGFNPTASVFQGQDCGGVRFEITDREALRPTELGLALAHTLLRLYGDRFELAKLEPLLSHRATMEALRAGRPWQEIALAWRKEAAAFEERRKPYLIYPR